MNWKKYAILSPPFLLIGALLLFYLPLSQLHYMMLAPLLFGHYTTCGFTQKETDRKKKHTKKSSFSATLAHFQNSLSHS